VFPISQYWFVLVYVLLSTIAPYIETMLLHITIEEQKKLVIIMMFIWCGYTFLIDNEVIGANRGYSLGFAIVLYIIGNYIRKSNIEIKWQITFLIYICVTILNGLAIIGFSAVGKQKFGWKLYSYNNPLVLAGAISLILLFCHIRTTSFLRKISHLGKYTFYIYIFHSTPILANWYMQKIDDLYGGNISKFVILSIIVVICLFICGCIVGYIYEIFWWQISKMRVRRYNEKGEWRAEGNLDSHRVSKGDSNE